MKSLHQEIIELAVSYTLLGALVFTVVAVCLSLVGIVRFKYKSQQSILFVVLILELVTVSISYFDGKLNTTEKEKSFVELAGKKVLDNIDKNSIVFIHVSNENKRPEAEKLKDDLQKNGYIVSKIKNTGDNTPNSSEVRYFYRHQEEKAAILVKHISEFTSNKFEAKYMSGYDGIAHIDTIEVWFGKLLQKSQK